MFATLITFLHRAIMQGIPLLFGSTGEIITEKSGNLNLGIPGIMYIGGMSGVIGAFSTKIHSPTRQTPTAFLQFSFRLFPVFWVRSSQV